MPRKATMLCKNHNDRIKLNRKSVKAEYSLVEILQ